MLLQRPRLWCKHSPTRQPRGGGAPCSFAAAGRHCTALAELCRPAHTCARCPVARAPPADAPTRSEANRERNFRTKEETEKTKTVTSTVVATLLIIAVVVPMLQYYGYTAKD